MIDKILNLKTKSGSDDSEKLDFQKGEEGSIRKSEKENILYVISRNKSAKTNASNLSSDEKRKNIFRHYF